LEQEELFIDLMNRLLSKLWALTDVELSI